MYKSHCYDSHTFLINKCERKFYCNFYFIKVYNLFLEGKGEKEDRIRLNKVDCFLLPAPPAGVL